MTDLNAAFQAGSAAKRWQAINHLNQQKAPMLDANQLMLLSQALNDQHPFVRWQAGLALAKQPQGRQNLTDLVKSAASVEAQSAAADALKNDTSPAAYAGLMQALNSNSPLLRQSVVEALASQKNPQALPGLVNALKDTDPWVRRGAAYALGHLNNQEATPALITALKDPSVLVRRSAAYALGALRASTGVSHLISVLKDRDPIIRRNAAWALGRIGQSQALPELNKLLDDPALDGSVALTASKAIETITRPRWLQTLLGVRGRFRQQA